MPYVSKKQERFFHTKTAAEKGIKPSTVKEFDHASKGLKLPEQANKSGSHDNRHHNATDKRIKTGSPHEQ